MKHKKRFWENAKHDKSDPLYVSLCTFRNGKTQQL